MSTSQEAVPELRRYVDHRPYPEPPARLDDLTGPTSGTVELPVTIDWGPRRSYDLGEDADRSRSGCRSGRCSPSEMPLRPRLRRRSAEVKLATTSTSPGSWRVGTTAGRS